MRFAECVHIKDKVNCACNSLTARAGLDHSVKLFKHTNKICNGSKGQVNKVIVHAIA